MSIDAGGLERFTSVDPGPASRQWVCWLASTTLEVWRGLPAWTSGRRFDDERGVMRWYGESWPTGALACGEISFHRRPYAVGCFVGWGCQLEPPPPLRITEWFEERSAGSKVLFTAGKRRFTDYDRDASPQEETWRWAGTKRLEPALQRTRPPSSERVRRVRAATCTRETPPALPVSTCLISDVCPCAMAGRRTGRSVRQLYPQPLRSA